ncbi:MAG: hypothetical protein ACI4CT_09515 [Lachnospiraceae bacterium]
MRKTFKKVSAFALAVAMVIPMMGITAKAELPRGGWVEVYDTNEQASTPWTKGKNDQETGAGTDNGNYRVASTEAPWTATMTAASEFTENGVPCLGMVLTAPIQIEQNVKYKVVYTVDGNVQNNSEDKPRGVYVNVATYSGTSRKDNWTNNNQTEVTEAKEMTYEFTSSYDDLDSVAFTFILRRVAPSNYVTISDVKVYKYVTDLTGHYELTLEDETYSDVAYNSLVALEASKINEEGEVFSHWTKNGYTVSYSRAYSFYVCEDATVKAVYADEAPEVKGCYYVMYGLNTDNELEYYIETTSPDDSETNLCWVGSRVDILNGDEDITKGKYAIKESTLSKGTHQYYLNLGDVTNFDPGKYAQIRNKFEFGKYYDEESKEFGTWINFIHWYAKNGSSTQEGTDTVWIGNPKELVGINYQCGTY